MKSLLKRCAGCDGFVEFYGKLNRVVGTDLAFHCYDGCVLGPKTPRFDGRTARIQVDGLYVFGLR